MKIFDKNNKTPGYLIIIFIIATAFTALVFGAYLLHIIINKEFVNDITELRNIWAQFGGYAGGALSPLLAFLALIALLYSINIQTTELNRSTEQLSKSAAALDNQNKLIQKQNFETTFFQLLKLYNEIVQTSTVTQILGLKQQQNIVKNGRNAFTFLRSRLMHEYLADNKIDKHDPEKSKKENYAKFYKDYGDTLGHYFRTIYNILKFVGCSDMTYEEQKIYSDILRAQLSADELILLFYNVFYFEGIGKGNMHGWAQQYNIFKHIEKKILLDSDHQKLKRISEDYHAYRFTIISNPNPKLFNKMRKQ